jgi:fumarylacetoacetate (FAA) hydrolase
VKLATERNGSRDGRLLLVSRDLKWAVAADDIAPTLQYVLDEWPAVAGQLEQRYAALNAGEQPDAAAFDPGRCHSPLPRAYQWADGSAYVTHVELVRKARGAELPPSFWEDPLMYQGGSDAFLAPTEPIQLADEAWGIDLEAEIAVITDDVPMGVAASDASRHIRLLMLVNDVSLRNLIPGELAKNFGFFHGKPSTAFAPVAVTPDELGTAWDGRRVHLAVSSHVNDRLIGAPEAGDDMTFDYPTLIAHAARTRRLAAGTIIGGGTVSNTDRRRGSACLAEVRMLETIEHGAAKTPFLRFGDRVRIEVHDRAGVSVFGRIDQRVERYQPSQQTG